MGRRDGILYDAVADPEFGRALLAMVERHRRIMGATGELTASTTRFFHELRGPREEPCEPRVLSAEQSNTLDRLRRSSDPQTLPPPRGRDQS